MKRSVITFLCISSIILSPYLQAFPGASLLPQWRVGQLPTLTRKTIDAVHTEHFRAYAKNVALFSTIGSAIGGILGMLSFNQLVNQPRSIAITTPLVIYACCIGTGLYCAFRSPRSRSLLNRLNLLNRLKNRVGNITLTQQSINDALDLPAEPTSDNEEVRWTPKFYLQYAINCYKEISCKQDVLTDKEEQVLKERYGSRYVQEYAEKNDGIPYGNWLLQERTSQEGTIIFLFARAIYRSQILINYFPSKSKNEILEILQQERLAREVDTQPNAQRT